MDPELLSMKDEKERKRTAYLYERFERLRRAMRDVAVVVAKDASDLDAEHLHQAMSLLTHVFVAAEAAEDSLIGEDGVY